MIMRGFDEIVIQACRGMAHEAHEGQFRKYGNDPYIVHPEAVYNKLVEVRERYGKDEFQAKFGNWSDIAGAAWLHDVLEDCHKSFTERIIELEGDIYRIVCELTNPSKGSKLSRKERKQMDRDHLKNVSIQARLLKLIDRICNLRDLSTCPDTNFIKLYVTESQLLLECLRETDKELEAELQSAIFALWKAAVTAEAVQ